MKTQKKLTYQEAIEELQQIEQEIEENQISIDQLTEKIKRANHLIELCKTMLRTAEEDVNQLFNKS